MNSEEMSHAYVQQREPTEEEIERFYKYYKDVKVKAAELNARITALEKRWSWDKLAEDIHEVNEQKGFWSEPEMMDKYAAKLALVHSEVTEVLEALRKGQGSDKVTEEVADILIRLFDLYSVLVEAGEADSHLFRVMREKMQKNKERAPKHGNRWG